MANPAAERVLAALRDLGFEPQRSGKGWSARCPAHDDHHPSLSISDGENGGAVLKCHAGCETSEVVAAIGLTMQDLMLDDSSGHGQGSTSRTAPKQQKGTRKQAQRGRTKECYDYRDEAGDPLFQVVRREPKSFYQRCHDPEGGWTASVQGVRIVPYRLPELLAADPSQPVFVCEGEKDANALAGLELVATCNSGGAGKWTPQHAGFLRGRRVVVLPDNDDAGRKHAQQVAQTLQNVAEWVRVVELPRLPDKGDVSDWLAAGGTVEELLRLVDETREWTPETSWSEIIRFDVLDLREFPTHVLPGVLRNWVEWESYATQTPADMAALMALAAVSATIARRVDVQPSDAWNEPVNLFVSVLLDPGNRKSAVVRDAIEPLREVEREMGEAARPQVARAQSERRQAELRLKQLEKLAGEKEDHDAREQAGELAAELAIQPEPTLPRLIVDDATQEKLGIMLAEQGGRIASMSAEGGVFDLMAGMYSKSGMPQFNIYLMGHSGDELVVDRVSRREVHVSRPALTCAYAMQPQVIKGLAEHPAFRDRGLLARFLYAAPRSWLGEREIEVSPMPEETREEYRQMVRRLALWEGELVLRLDADAACLFWEWAGEIEFMLGDGGELELMRDWGGKLAGATLRLAAVMHCAEYGPNGLLTNPTIAAAIEIARYLIPHAEAVLNMMQMHEDPTDADARYVLRWIERHQWQEFTKSEAQHHGKRRFRRADDIDPALAELVRRGYIRPKPVVATGPGRPPSPTYDVNPVVLADAKPTKRSFNSCNSAAESHNDNFGNNGSALERSENTNGVRVRECSADLSSEGADYNIRRARAGQNGDRHRKAPDSHGDAFKSVRPTPDARAD